MEIYNKANDNGFHLSNRPTNSKAVGGRKTARRNKSHGEDVASCEGLVWRHAGRLFPLKRKTSSTTNVISHLKIC